jgi:acetyl-CoA/propionyl-CoA carboxylase biotin carboxyl carrier protein
LLAGARHVLVSAPGSILEWKVPDGAVVQSGDIVGMMEATKMEMHIHALHSGEFRFHRSAGSSVAAGIAIASTS